ncbi:MAG: DUF4159 domain-containing protein [Akkermansia sp.]|nr:DUF4159 domain-containing protein [Akkermansia sp.]
MSLFAKEGVVQCGNLIYAGSKTSRCFSDEFLSTVQQRTGINTSRRFRAVRMDNDELFRFPFVVMTGEGNFSLTPKERENLRKYVEGGGFLLASAGCSSEEWNRAFRREMKDLFGEASLQPVPMSHPVFSTVYHITVLKAGKKPTSGYLEGITYNGKLVIIYSADGLNDSENSRNCCCCGGSELGNALEVNANILAYALLR